MIRVFVAALVAAAIIGALFHFGSGGVFAVFVVLFVLIAVTNLGKLRCPYCRKRVKLNARACHHCGREVQPFIERFRK
jgi:hypothetical protein